LAAIKDIKRAKGEGLPARTDHAKRESAFLAIEEGGNDREKEGKKKRIITVAFGVGQGGLCARHPWVLSL